MFWSKKEEKKGLPELPPMRNLFNKSFDEEKQPLPSFPDSPARRGFSQTAIKEAVGPEEDDISEEIIEKVFPRQRDMDESEETAKEIFTKQEKTASEDVYVKIDRFHSARKALNGAREKLQEIDTLLKKIRETRMREEQELASWEKEINSVKNKVEDVTNNIFEKA